LIISVPCADQLEARKLCSQSLQTLPSVSTGKGVAGEPVFSPFWHHSLFRWAPSALLFDFLSDLKWPIRSNPEKEIGRRFVIEPSVDFDFVSPAQFPDLVFDLSDIHSYYSAFNVQLNW
jgi:hypothetical protein